jgi:hypothetical protein
MLNTNNKFRIVSPFLLPVSPFLVAEDQAAGEHHVRWDRTDAAGTPVAQGVYLARLALPGTSAVRKLVVQR